MSLENYHIIESTLREGEQFIGSQVTREQKIRIAHGLDGFGVEYLELTSPLASPGCLDDVKTIVGLGLRHQDGRCIRFQGRLDRNMSVRLNVSVPAPVEIFNAHRHTTHPCWLDESRMGG